MATVAPPETFWTIDEALARAKEFLEMEYKVTIDHERLHVGAGCKLLRVTPKTDTLSR